MMKLAKDLDDWKLKLLMSWKLNTVKNLKQLKKSHMMTLLKVLHLIWLLKNAENCWIASRNGWRRSSPCYERIHGQHATSRYLSWNVLPNHWYNSRRSSQTIWSWRWQNVWKLTLLSKLLLLLKDSTLQKKKSKKEINDLAAEYNMEVSQVSALLSPEMLKHDITMKKAVEVITSTAKS